MCAVWSFCGFTEYHRQNQLCDTLGSDRIFQPPGMLQELTFIIGHQCYTYKNFKMNQR